MEEKDFDFSAQRVTASVHESLGRLGLDYLDIVQAHDVEFGSLDQARLLPQLQACHACQCLSSPAVRSQSACDFYSMLPFCVALLPPF